MEHDKKLVEWTNNNELAMNIFDGKYKYEDETFDETIDRIAGHDETVRYMIMNKYFLPGGRICANRGLDHKGKKVTLSNCYVMKPVEDNIESIFDTAKELARTYSYGGGCGVDISKLSFKGAIINNAAKNTSGAVSFMDLYSMVTEIISQNGRRAALMISMDVSHPDIIDFIKVKTDTSKVTKANISVRISDEFMEAVKNNKGFNLSFTRPETGEVCAKSVRARDLFHLMAETNWDYAEPGMLFWDRIKSWSLSSNNPEFEFAGVNPCVTGDTLILTDKGYYPIKMLVGSKVNIWNGYQWSEVEPRVTGVNQPIRYIECSDGAFVKCTDYHKFILADGSRVEAKDLKEGDKLVKCEYPVIEGWATVVEKLAYTKGFLTGDGCVDERNRQHIYLYGEKMNLVPYLHHKKLYDYTESSNRYVLLLDDQMWTTDKFWVPGSEFTIQTRLNWLAGYIDSDGTLNDKGGSIAITSINKDLLLRVKLMLNTLGVTAHIGDSHDAAMRLLPDHNGGYKEYQCQKTYRITISAYNVAKLIQLGLRTHRVSLIANPNRSASRFITIAKNIPLGVEPEVYCFNEPINHSGIFNGIITAQCGEEPLPAYGACLLGSINLSAFVVDPFTHYARFDYVSFKETVRNGVIELNKILDEGIEHHPLEQQKKTARDWRQIGLGVMGIADMLIKLGITYGSKRAINVCDDIANMMATVAIKTSCALAEKYGPFEKFNYDYISESRYFKAHTTEDMRKKIKQYGLRNSQLLTIAPTGSLSNVLGISGGIEPIFANYYERKTESLHGEDVFYKVYTPIVKEYMDAHNLKDESELPEYFVTSKDISYEDRIKMQAIWQKHIDASISSTVNLPESATVEDVEDLYMKAWENGLKGITVYRDHCKRSGILSTDTNKKKEEPKEEKIESVVAPGLSPEDITRLEEKVDGLMSKEDKKKLNNIASKAYEMISCDGQIKADNMVYNGLKRGEVVKVSDNVFGLKRKLITGCGTLHCIAMFDDKTKQLVETYLSKGSTGGCNNFMIGLSRMISIAARGGISIYDIVDQLDSTGVCPSYATRRATKGDTSIGSCCPMAVGKALIDMYEEANGIGKYVGINHQTVKDTVNAFDETVKACDELHNFVIGQTEDNTEEFILSEESKCPVCGSKLEHEGGCDICKNCGWTRCD